MHKIFNGFLVIAVLVSGFILYNLEHTTRGLERQVAAINQQIDGDREMIRMLDAEWSSLTRPDRLMTLAGEHLHLQPIAAAQIVTEDELAQRVPAEPIVKLEAQDKDPIGDILQKMQ
jgi:cell division protein FtsL